MGFRSDFDGALKVQWLLLVHECDRDHSVDIQRDGIRTMSICSTPMRSMPEGNRLWSMT
jgi:hypothetical protein